MEHPHILVCRMPRTLQKQQIQKQHTMFKSITTTTTTTPTAATTTTTTTATTTSTAITIPGIILVLDDCLFYGSLAEYDSRYAHFAGTCSLSCLTDATVYGFFLLQLGVGLF